MEKELYLVLYEDGDYDWVLAESEEDVEDILQRVWLEANQNIPAHRVIQVPDRNAPYILR